MMNNFLSKFSDCFGEIGPLKNTHHSEIKDNVTQAVTLVRKIPLPFKLKLEKELKRMVDLDIIELVQKPTDWVNVLVVVGKPPNVNTSIFLPPKKSSPNARVIFFQTRRQIKLLAN